ncbi:MAG: phosphoenolpyruvate synthase [Clostridiales bacterium]|nr:phosphoenolpyruvate synthase [Clostridiales bacterium]
MIVRLDNREDNGEKLGNKGKFLLLMRREGFNVPNGFVLDSDVYDKTVSENGIGSDIKTALSGLNKDNIKETGEKIAKLFDDSKLPQDIRKEIEEIADKSKLYAVRSSGTKEDLDEFSFAGQYQTFLNTSYDDIERNVINCYKSMFSEIILSYLINKSIDLEDLKMSVVCQEMVDSDYSGICFTIDPVTGNDKTMLIEVSEGLGENIVSGKTVPQRYYYDWYEDLEKDRDEKNTFLSPEKVKEYAGVFAKIGQHFGYPCDIEFAIKDGKLYILQSRRITKISYTGITDVWTTADFKDGGVSANVCTPYMWSLYEYIWEYSLRTFIVDSKILKDEELPKKLGEMYYGRCYWNLSAVKKTMKQIVGYKEREFDNEYGIVGDYVGDGVVTKATPKVLIKMIPIIIKQKGLLDDRRKNSERYKQELLDLYYDYKKKIDEHKIEDITKAYMKITRETYLRSETTYFHQIFINTIHQSLYKDSLLKYVSESEYLSLLGSIDNISHLLPFYDMWDITRSIRADEEKAKFWKENDALSLKDHIDSDKYNMPEVRKLIEDYGYHSDKELDITYPCYYEEPEVLIAMVKDMALLDDSFSPKEDKERGTEVYTKILDDLKTKVSSGTHKKISKKVANMRRMLWWREEFRDVSTRFYYMLRMYTIEYAKKLEKDGVLDKWEDIWFLKVGQVWDYIEGKKTSADLKEIIRKNKIYYNAYRNYISDNEIGHDFKVLKDPESKNSIRGLGANNGKITATARVIEDFTKIDRLKQGDILVTRFTDTGWTPKFAILSGIVTEYGGILCHAAIVSREYGIPAIVCCKDAMSKIKDGQTITIDGSTGIVEISDGE